MEIIVFVTITFIAVFFGRYLRKKFGKKLKKVLRTAFLDDWRTLNLVIEFFRFSVHNFLEDSSNPARRDSIFEPPA